MKGTLPRGFRDILPTEARELHAIERSLMSSFARHGYVPLEPPTVEFAEGAVTVDERRTLRFLDRDGRLLALRPDVTTAVARVVAQRYRQAGAALRLAYFTPIFREEASMRGSEREYDQAGVELIGDAGLRADAEVIALLAKGLADCGLLGIDIDVGHVGYVGGFIADLPPDARGGVDAAARGGDLVGAAQLARAAGMPAARVASLERGLRHRSMDLVDLADLRRDAPAASCRALDALGALAPLLEAAGAGGAVRFDLGLVPALPYYTGVVFQVTAPGLGFAIANGGRYDDLLARFGADRPATGFGIAIPHLHQALIDAGWQAPSDSTLLLLTPHDDDVVTLRLATALRAAGIAVAIGDVAETAGQRVARARVVDEGHLDYEGVVRAVEAVIAVLTGGGPR